MPCEHRRRTNFAVSHDSVQHEYCPECGWHLFRGREYTKQEWYRAYIEEGNSIGENEASVMQKELF